MPNRRRNFVPGVSLHVRQRGNNRCAIFGDDSDYHSYLVMLASAAREHGVAIHGYSLMTTHTHLLLTPNTKQAPSRAMHQVGVRYVLYFNRKYQRVGTLWTGRYKAKPITDERYWLTCMRYVELNPVRAGIVEAPGTYRWSSYLHHGLGTHDDLVAEHPLYLGLGTSPEARQQAWREICGHQIPENELDKLRQALKSGIIIGEPSYVEVD